MQSDIVTDVAAQDSSDRVAKVKVIYQSKCAKTTKNIKEVSRVRARFASGLVKRAGLALAGVARRVGVSALGISKIHKREYK
jgi:hypothetical protein